MRGMVPIDPQTKVSQSHFAVVIFQDEAEKRFPASCVEVKNSKDEALEGASEKRKNMPLS